MGNLIQYFRPWQRQIPCSILVKFSGWCVSMCV